jgi:glycosyltransferase involved in cell wall biosynthesis
MQSPLVSIIVPVWNVERYLSRCLRSLAAQTLGNVEFIIVDDGSTDSSAAICREFAAQDPRFKVFSKENGGQGLARNFGLDRASGSYVCYVDSDDWVDPTMCARAVETIEREGADFVSFGLDFVKPSGRVVKSIRLARYALLRQPALFNCALLDDQVLTTAWNKLYRRALLVDSGVRFPSTRVNEDIFYSRAVGYVARKTAFVPQVLYHALVRPDSASRRMSTGHFTATREVLAHERDFFERHPGPALDENLFSAHVVKVFSYLLVQAAFRISSRAEYDECFEIADSCRFLEFSRSPTVLEKLQRKGRLLAFLCRHRTLLRGMAGLSRLVGMSPY